MRSRGEDKFEKTELTYAELEALDFQKESLKLLKG
jgi:hypothetical protein